jgi:hypothetical protein
MPNLFDNFAKYRRNLFSAINKWQNAYGYPAELYRLCDRENNSYVEAYGPSRVQIKDISEFTFIKKIRISALPQELYNLLSVSQSEIELKFSDNDFLTGDCIKFKWLSGKILEYFVMEPPRTYGDSLFVYKLSNSWNTDDKINGTSIQTN